MPETCSKCLAPLDEDAIFCPSCATPVNPKCPSCGKTMNAETKFCKYCAFDFSKKNPPANVRMWSRSGVIKTVLAVVLMLILLSVAYGIGYVVGYEDGKTEPSKLEGIKV